MRASLLLLAAGLAAASPVNAQLVITSFNQNGQLTFTNVVTNATYRIEWAGSPTGTWHSFDVLTNLSSIAATSTAVTVQVPTFYRVVWTDAPNPVGDWDYQAYDAAGALVVTGLLSVISATNVAYDPDVRILHGGWNFSYAGPPTNSIIYLGPLVVTNTTSGGLSLSLRRMMLGYSPGLEVGSVIVGDLSGNTFTGRWAYYAGGSEFTGPFTASRRPRGFAFTTSKRK